MAQALIIDQNLTSTPQINEEEEEKEDSGNDAEFIGNKVPEETNTSNSNTGARRGSRNNATALKSKVSELTLSFEGKVYVFHKVNQKRCKLWLQYLEGVIYLMAGNAHAA